ncbi:MAG TPA: diguanylate cyclase [Steroidobacteraceae bacterium]|nr:diguanylate cyclase [Steroidobacteraceae bacterium]
MDPSRSGLSVLPNSPYAAELERAAARQRFSPQFEAQYLRARLQGIRTLIRAACALAVLLTLFRGGHHLLAGTWDEAQVGLLAVVLSTSIALAAIAWSRAFERWYLTVAQILVPPRNWLAAVGVAAAVAHGHVEALMILPLMVFGPFFFLGLPIRVAAVTVVLTVASFLAAAVAFGVDMAVVLRACVFLLLAAGACSIAARHLEKWSRRSFLEGRLVAELAQHDALTGLKNRRVFDEHLDTLWEQAIADGRALGILLIDVDHFKGYNDLYGHQAGDKALHRVAGTLQGLVSRPRDLLARYGGEEFAVTLYGIDGFEAQAIAERMRLAVSELGIAHRGSPPGGIVTISVGVAVIEPSRERRPRGALQLADQALYKAKLEGRNRVEVMDHAAHGQMVTGIFSTASLMRQQ